MINLRLKFKGKKTISLPIYSFDKNTFKILIPVYEDGNVIDIIQLNLPQQVVQKPTERLYRYLRMRGVI